MPSLGAHRQLAHHGLTLIARILGVGGGSATFAAWVGSRCWRRGAAPSSARCSTASCRSRSCSPTVRAGRSGSPTRPASPPNWSSAPRSAPSFDRVAYTHEVLDALARHQVDLIAMAGFGTILSKPIHDAFPDRIVNTHPALLPAFKGWHAVDDALAYGVKVTGCTVHLARLEVDEGPDPRPGGGAGAARRHRRDAPRTDQGSRTADLPRSAAKVGRMMRTKITRALLSVYDKTGIVEFARELQRRGVELVSSGGTAKAIADAGIPVTAVDDITGVPPILDHRVVTLHPKIHGGILADRSKPSHDDDMATYGIQPFDLVVSNLYPFAQNPDIETIDVGGPAMVRAAAKNHAFVTIVTDASQYAPLLEELDANDNTVGDDTRRAPRDRRVREHRGLRRADRRVDATRRGPSRVHRPRARAHRRSVALRREPAPARGALPHRGHEQLVGRRAAARRAWRSRTSTSTTPTPRGASCTTSPSTEEADRRSRSSSTPTRAASPLADDLATAYQRALECDERSAFGGIVALNRPVDAATAERMVAGPQADLVLAPGWEPGTVDALIAKRKNTRLIEAGAARGAPGLDFRQISGGFLVQDAHHFAASARRLAGRHQARTHRHRVARRRAGVAHLRAREVERDRAGEGRAGGRHRRRPAEPGRVGRDRGQEGRRARGRRRVRVGRVLPVPRRHRGRGRGRASRSWCNRAARCATSPTSNGPTSSVSPWCSPEKGTSSIDCEDDARRSRRRRGVRRPRPAQREAHRQRAHPGARHDPRRRRRRRARATSA